MAQEATAYHALPQTSVSPTEEQWDDHREELWSTASNAGLEQIQSHTSVENSRPLSRGSISRKPVPSNQPELRLHEAPANPVSISPPKSGIRQSDAAEITRWPFADSKDEEGRGESLNHYGTDSRPASEAEYSLPVRNLHPTVQLKAEDDMIQSRTSSAGSYPRIDEDEESNYGQESEVASHEGLQYHAFDDVPKKHQHQASQATMQSAESSSSGGDRRSVSQQLSVPRTGSARPVSTYSDHRGRTLSPFSANGSDGSPIGYPRDSSSRRSPAGRPTSYVDMLNNVPHSQQVAPGGSMANQSLQSVVGNAASLLDTKKTLEMYRVNVKKTNDAAVQYEFAILMVNTARDATPESGLNPSELINEAKSILNSLSGRSYPFAQYYLADGLFSGLFNKDKPDYDKAFQMFAAAARHGHAEAGYRTALCYEFGWGTNKSYQKAVQFYRASASKNHPGAATRLGLACIHGDMGLVGRQNYREGGKWLKRAQESADFQYNAAPYELGMLHLTGYGDDIFKDEAYAAQLLTQSAELGHVQANFLMGQAYENGLYGCPRDAALSVHFYNGAATRGHPEAMMALCAWYMVGAEPVLEKDEGEAYAWAQQAAETGWAKAEYAVGYFTEMGIGCRRDPLEANMWYVRAADQGNETAKQRLQIIRAAASGDPGIPAGKTEAKGKEKKKFMGIF